MHPLPFSARERGGGELSILPNFQKGGLAESRFLEGGCWEREGDLFMEGDSVFT